MLTDNLVSYWKLDESSGNAADSVGANTGTATDITYAAGKLNNCATGNGTSSFMQLPDGIFRYNYADPLTITACIKFNTSADQNINIIYHACGAGSSYWGYHRWGFSATKTSTTKTLMFDYTPRDSQNNNTIGSFTWVADTWYHVAVSKPATGRNDWKLYVNGTPLSCTPSGSTTTNLETVIEHNYLGCASVYYISEGKDYFKGAVDEVRIWNRALSDAEILQVYALDGFGANTQNFFQFIN